MKRFLWILAFCTALTQARAQDLTAVESMMEKEKYTEALELAGELALDAESSGDFTQMIKAQSLMVEACLGLGDEEKAYDILASTLGHFTGKQLYDIMYYANGLALFQISRIYSEIGNLEEARLYAINSLKFPDTQSRGNIKASRYSMIASLDMRAGNYKEALKDIEEAFKNTSPLLSLASLSEMTLQKVMCLDGLGRAEETPALLEEMEALVNKTSDEQYLNHHTAVFLRLADGALERQDSIAAQKYADSALKHAKKFQDRIEEAESYKYLAKLCGSCDAQLAERYASMADSLSYEPYLRKMVGKVAFNNLEFARRERDQKIKIQSLRITLLVTGLIILAIALLLCLVLLRKRKLASRLHREQIASLKKSLEQREKLLAVANAVTDPIVRKDLSKAVGGIMGDLPVKLTARELEVARLATQGLMNKEIAYKLGISTRTVEAHRNNVYHKLEISNLSELKYYLNAIDQK